MQELNSQNFYLFTKIIRWRKTKAVGVLLCTVVLTALMLDWSFVRYRLLDESMSPVFWGGQKVVTLRWAYLFQEPQRGDLIIYMPYTGTFWPGKVIAVPGDVIKVSNGTLLLNTIPCSIYQMPVGFTGSEMIVPDKYVCVVEPTPLQTPSRIKLVPQKSISGKILGNWQVLII